MRNIKYYLDAARNKLDPPTDYRLAKFLAAGPSLISNYRNGLSYPNEGMSIRLAKLLKINPIEIIAVANYHRAVRIHASEERKFWRQIYNETR